MHTSMMVLWPIFALMLGNKIGVVAVLHKRIICSNDSSLCRNDREELKPRCDALVVGVQVTQVSASAKASKWLDRVRAKRRANKAAGPSDG